MPACPQSMIRGIAAKLIRSNFVKALSGFKNLGFVIADLMTNYLLFKQLFCLILIFETLVLWPKFERYFGPLAFPKSFFTTWVRIHTFNLFLLASLASLALNFYPLIASFFVLICMRYLYVTDAKNRISTAGAVGHLCYLTSAYIFLFETAKIFDKSGNLSQFFLSILAIEIGVIMTSAGVYKYLLGYFDGTGFEYALVNPSWSKLFFLFNKLSPNSWVFTFSNWGAFLGEICSGLMFLIPMTRTFGAYLLIFVFIFVFLTVRVAILPLIMISLALLFIPEIHFQVWAVEMSFQSVALPHTALITIKIGFLVYIAIFVLATIFRWIRLKTGISIPNAFNWPLEIFMAYRPFFEWGVFTAGLTNFFIKIETASKMTGKIHKTLYDGFSKNYREVFDSPKLFTRFIHHHESSFMLNIFVPVVIEEEEKQRYIDIFIKKMSSFGKTLLTSDEIEDSLIVYTIVYIEKAGDHFIYTPLYSYFVDALKNQVIQTKVYKELEPNK